MLLTEYCVRLCRSALRRGWLLGLSALLLTPIQPPAAAAPLVGIKTSGRDDSVKDFASFRAWLGNGRCTGRTTFEADDTWDAIANPYFLDATKQWIDSAPGNWECIGVGLVPKNDKENFAAVVSGKHDADFRSLAKHIKDLGIGSHVIIRLGYEFNGDWMAWSGNVAPGTPATYAAAFRRAVTQMRSIDPSLRFCWCASDGDTHGSSPWKWEDAYPGDGFVDYIGLDVYDFWNPKGWPDLLNHKPGLQQIRKFAQAHGKPECYPEWGLASKSNGGGKGDDPQFIRNMYNWFNAPGANVAFQCFWDCSCDKMMQIQGETENAPKSAAVYRKLFGAPPRQQKSKQ